MKEKAGARREAESDCNEREPEPEERPRAPFKVSIFTINVILNTIVNLILIN